MNRTLPLILTAALLLTACASAVPAQPADATTSLSAAASSPSQPAAETSAPPLTPKFPVGHLLTLPQNQNSGPVWNTGDALYELRDASNMTPEALVLKTDYAALTQSVYCDIPGCTTTPTLARPTWPATSASASWPWTARSTPTPAS